MNDIQAVIQAAQSVGNWVLFFWLYMKERERTQHVSDEHKADLRRIAAARHLMTQEETD